MEIATFDLASSAIDPVPTTPAAPTTAPDAPWLPVTSVEPCGQAHVWQTAFGPVANNTAALHYGGLGDVLFQSLNGPGDLSVEVQCNESMELRAARIVLTERGQSLLQAPGGQLCSEAALCMALSRLHHLTRRPVPPGGAWRWPRPQRRRRRRQLLDHQRRALDWMRSLELEAPALAVRADGSMPVGDQHVAQFDDGAPGCCIRRAGPDGGCGRPWRSANAFTAVGAGLFDPVGSGKAATVAALLADAEHSHVAAPRLLECAHSLGGHELLPAPAETLLVCSAQSVPHWGKELRAAGVYPVTAETHRELTTLRARADAFGQGPRGRVAIVASSALSGTPYSSWFATTVAQLAGFTDRGSLGDVQGDPTLVRIASRRASRSDPTQGLPVELFAWPRVVVDDAHVSRIRVAAGFSWSVTGTPGPIDDYIDRFLPGGVPEWLWSRVAHEASRKLCWRWAPPPPDGPFDAARIVAHSPTEPERASALDDGLPPDLVALQGARVVVRSPAERSVAVAEAEDYTARTATQLERSATAYDAEPPPDAVPAATAALITDARAMRLRAESLRRELGHFKATVTASGFENEACPVCMGPPSARIVPLCGHMVCGDCMRRITGVRGSHRCAVCRSSLRPDAMWWVGDPATPHQPIGSAAARILEAVRGAERAAVWCGTAAEATAATAALKGFTSAETLKGTAAARKATCRRLGIGQTRVVVVPAYKVQGRVPLQDLTDVVIYGDIGDWSDVARALAPLMPLAGGVGAQLHLIGEAAVRCVTEWRDRALAESTRACTGAAGGPAGGASSGAP